MAKKPKADDKPKPKGDEKPKKKRGRPIGSKNNPK
jgi:hypothetical protein